MAGAVVVRQLFLTSILHTELRRSKFDLEHSWVRGTKIAKMVVVEMIRHGKIIQTATEPF